MVYGVERDARNEEEENEVSNRDWLHTLVWRNEPLVLFWRLTL